MNLSCLGCLVITISFTGDLDIEALRAKYAAAYDSDFEMPEDSEEETTEYEDSSEEDEESEGE